MTVCTAETDPRVRGSVKPTRDGLVVIEREPFSAARYRVDVVLKTRTISYWCITERVRDALVRSAKDIRGTRAKTVVTHLKPEEPADV